MKRYSHDMKIDTMYKFGDGDYVRYSDYEKLYNALERIYHYDGNEIWWDDRDDAADEMMVVAGVALGIVEE